MTFHFNMWVNTFLVLFLLTGSLNAQRTYDLVLEKLVKVMIDRVYVDAGTLRVTRVNRTHTVVTGGFKFFEQIDRDVKVTILVYEQIGTEYKRSAVFLMRDKPVCDFLDSEMIGMTNFKCSTNMPLKCPIPPGNYSVNNFVLDPSRYPIHIPGGHKWRTDLILKKDDFTWGHIQLFVRIDRLPMFHG